MKRLLTFTTLTTLCLSLALPAPSSSPIAVDEVKTGVSPEMDVFIEHFHGFYYSDIYASSLKLKEKAMFLGFALGRQAANVKDNPRRKRIFQKIESDLLGFLVRLVLLDSHGRGTIDEAQATKDAVELWYIARMAMMGFFDDSLIEWFEGFHIDTRRIPNMFDPWDEEHYPAEDDAVAGVYSATMRFVSAASLGTLVLRGTMEEVKFEYRGGAGDDAWHWTGILRWDGSESSYDRNLSGPAKDMITERYRPQKATVTIRKGSDGKWRGVILYIMGNSYNLNKRR